LETGFRSEVMCIDENAEAIGSSSSEGNMDVYPLEQGSVDEAMPNYTPFAELTCVLCVPATTSSIGSIYTRVFFFVVVCLVQKEMKYPCLMS